MSLHLLTQTPENDREGNPASCCKTGVGRPLNGLGESPLPDHILLHLSCSVATEGAPQFPLSALVICTEAGWVFSIRLTLAEVLPCFLSPGVHSGKEHKEDMALLEWVRSRATKMMRGLEQGSVAQVPKVRSPARGQGGKGQ